MNNKLLIIIILIAFSYYLYKQSINPVYSTKITQTSPVNNSDLNNNLEIENSLDKLIAEIQQLNLQIK